MLAHRQLPFDSDSTNPPNLYYVNRIRLIQSAVPISNSTEAQTRRIITNRATPPHEARGPWIRVPINVYFTTHPKWGEKSETNRKLIRNMPSIETHLHRLAVLEESQSISQQPQPSSAHSTIQPSISENRQNICIEKRNLNTNKSQRLTIEYCAYPIVASDRRFHPSS